MQQVIEVLRWKETSPKRREEILLRSQVVLSEILPEVTGWLTRVEREGDTALVEYARTFDRSDFRVQDLIVSDAEREAAVREVSNDFLSTLREQIALSNRFHTEMIRSLPREFETLQRPGVIAGYRRIPLESVGLYVPAGKAPLPTVAQVLTVAARAAGVPRIVVCFPPTSPEAEAAIIVAALEAGAHEMYRIGGIAAIGALAFGTDTIRPVQKIAGPGSPWVQAAKLGVVQYVGIDMFSGPSEAIIIGDDSANPDYVAADILARCEHGPDSAAVLVTASESLAYATQRCVAARLPSLGRQDYITAALRRFSAIVLVDSIEEAIEFTNAYKPEHLEIQTEEPRNVFERVHNAGSTFLGSFAPVAVGDYASGTNHCLPTGRAVGFSSAVSPETFMKVLQYQELSSSGLRSLEPIVRTISGVEGLDAHYESVSARQATPFLTVKNLRLPSLPFKPQALLWDLDGVILDSLACDLAQCAPLLSSTMRREVPIDEALIRKHFALSHTDFWRALLEELDLELRPEVFGELLNRYEEIRSSYRHPLLPGVLDTLEYASREGIPSGVVSNNLERFVEKALSRVGVRPYFDLIIGLDSSPPPPGAFVGQPLRKKPAPDLYLVALEQLSTPPAQSVVLEDSEVGVRAGLAAGCFVVGLSTGGTSKESLEQTLRGSKGTTWEGLYV